MTIDIAITPRLDKPRRRPNGLIAICFVLLAAVVFLAFFGRLVSPYDPAQQDLGLGLSGPSPAHVFGTDALGRDILSRLLAGTASAVAGPLTIAVGSLLIGSILGLIAGYRGGVVDALIMRTADLVFSLPGTLVIIVVAGAFGGGYWLAVALLVVLTVPADIRLVRGAVLEQVPRPYVEAAKSIGVSDLRIMVWHIGPNVAPVAVANLSIQFAGALVALAGLSFLGLGVPPGTADWGLMVAEGRSLLFVNPVAVLAPAVLIVVTATIVSILGDWGYERLSSKGATR